MPPRYWRIAWRAGHCVTRLSGLTCEPSTLDAGVARWISSWAGIPARPSRPPADGKAPTTRATSGQRSRASSGQLSLPGAFSRTSAIIYDMGSARSRTIYARWVSRLRRASLQRRRLARLTDASASSCTPTNWPTIATSDSRSSARHSTTTGIMHPGTMLTDAIRSWMTPGATDHKGSTRPGHRQLAEQVAHGGHPIPTTPTDGPSSSTAGPSLRRPWPTPDAAVMNDGQSVEALADRNARERAKGYNGNGGGIPLAMEVRMKGSKGRLNPNFVEWLMNLPVGHTVLTDSASSGTPSFRPRPRSRSDS